MVIKGGSVGSSQITSQMDGRYFQGRLKTTEVINTGPEKMIQEETFPNGNSMASITLQLRGC